MPHRLLWDGSYNIRDLGGITTRDGACIQAGQLIRADNLGHLTTLGQAMLVEYGICTIIDVRSSYEVRTWPHAFSQHETIATVNIPIGTAATSQAQHDLDTATDLVEWSRLALHHCRGAIGDLFQCVADAPPGGVLIHCHAGKDRTGVAIALLLALANVDPHVIAEDYAASDSGLQPLYDQWLADVVHDRQQYEERARALTSHPHTMRALLAHSDTAYGGITGYLEGCGIDQTVRESIRQRLCTPS